MDRKICLDTDILVNFIRGNEEDSDFIKRLENEATLATSTITIFELFRGIHKSNLKIQEEVAVNDIIQRFEILNFSPTSADIAAKVHTNLDSINEKVEIYLSQVLLCQTVTH